MFYEGHRTDLAFSCLDVADDGGQFRLHENDQCNANQLSNNAVSSRHETPYHHLPARCAKGCSRTFYLAVVREFREFCSPIHVC